MNTFGFKSCFLVSSAQPEIEEWSSWDEDAPTSIKIEGGNGNLSPSPNEMDEEPDYFKDMTPTIRKTQKVCPQTAQLIQYYPADATLIQNILNTQCIVSW